MRSLCLAFCFSFALCCLFPALAFAKPQPSAPADTPAASSAPQPGESAPSAKPEKGKGKPSPTAEPSTTPAPSGEPTPSASPSGEPLPRSAHRLCPGLSARSGE